MYTATTQIDNVVVEIYQSAWPDPCNHAQFHSKKNATPLLLFGGNKKAVRYFRRQSADTKNLNKVFTSF